jgi:hypothetical protein
MEKEGTTLNDQEKRNSSQKDEVTKTGWSSFGSQKVAWSLIGSVMVPSHLQA